MRLKSHRRVNGSLTALSGLKTTDEGTCTSPLDSHYVYSWGHVELGVPYQCGHAPDRRRSNGSDIWVLAGTSDPLVRRALVSLYRVRSLPGVNSDLSSDYLYYFQHRVIVSTR